MDFERGQPISDALRIGIKEKYEKALNAMALKYYERMPDPELFEEVEIFIETAMGWPRGVVIIENLKDRHGFRVKVSKGHLKKLGV